MRRRSRECALQILYQLDLNEQIGADAQELDGAIADYWLSFDAREVDRELAERLVRGVASDLAAIDARIAAASTRWRVDRMSPVKKVALGGKLKRLVKETKQAL